MYGKVCLDRNHKHKDGAQREEDPQDVLNLPEHKEL